MLTTVPGLMEAVRARFPALARAGVPGERLVWVDPVCEGPLSEGVEGGPWYAMRAAWLARRHGRVETEVLADLRALPQIGACTAEGLGPPVVDEGPRLGSHMSNLGKDIVRSV